MPERKFERRFKTQIASIINFPCRYNPEVGDLVIGRITEVRILLLLLRRKLNERRKVQPRRWKVDANARQDAVLMLSSVNLPGGVQVDMLKIWPRLCGLTMLGLFRFSASQIGER